MGDVASLDVPPTILPDDNKGLGGYSDPDEIAVMFGDSVTDLPSDYANHQDGFNLVKFDGSAGYYTTPYASNEQMDHIFVSESFQGGNNYWTNIHGTHGTADWADWDRDTDSDLKRTTD